MNRINMLMLAIVTAAMVLGSTALAADDKYTLKVPNGLAFSEFKGYENWQLVSVSEDGGKLALLIPCWISSIVASSKWDLPPTMAMPGVAAQIPAAASTTSTRRRARTLKVPKTGWRALPMILVPISRGRLRS